MIYGSGAAMGLSPRQVDEMTAWEFMACVAGYRMANGGEEAVKPPTPEEHDALMEKYA